MHKQHFTRSQTANVFKAAGVLPVTVHQSEPLCLLGGELKKTGPEGKRLRTMWSDFGGGREALDCDVHACAGREFAEETLGIFAGCGVDAAAVLQSAASMAEQLRTGCCSLEVVHELKKGKYHMFVAGTPYIDPLMFHLAAQQNASTMAVSGAEKTRFAWLPLREVLSAVSRAAPRYYVHAHISNSCIPNGWACSGGSTQRRLLLHPCFASSLRLARAAGLEQLLTTLAKTKVPLPLPPAARIRRSPRPRKASPAASTRAAMESATPNTCANPKMLVYWLSQEAVASCWQAPGSADALRVQARPA